MARKSSSDRSVGTPEAKRGSGNAARFARVARAFSRDTAVTSGGKGFGSTGLKVHGKLFAMIATRSGDFVVKLPRARAEALVGAGEASYFDPGHGRLMKEWVSVGPSGDWTKLAREAREFVGGARRSQRA